MKKSNIFLMGVLLIAILAVGALIYFSGQNNQSSPPQNTNASTTQNSPYTPQTSYEGDISYTVTPLDDFKTAEVWRFRVRRDTHSVDLEKNITQISALIDDNDATYNPTGWEGGPETGHHVQGILKFKAITPLPISIKLTIRETEETPARNLEWPLTP